MPRLGLGLGLSRSKTISNPEKELIKLSSFYIDPDKANGFKRPTGQDVNDPFINPIQDQVGDADVTLVGFAETVDSGYKVETNNGKSFTMLNFDGVNDYGDLVASEAPNPTGLQDFAQLVVFKPDTIPLDAYYGITRNDSGGLDMQYGFFTNGSGGYTYRIAGVSVQINGGATTNITWSLYGKIDDKKFLIINGLTIDEAIFNGLFVASDNVQFGCRSNSADGLTKATFANGLQGVCAFFYDGDNPLDKDKIVDTCKKFVAYKYGL